MKKPLKIAAFCAAVSAGCVTPLLIAAEVHGVQPTGAASVTFPTKMLLVLNTADETLFTGTMVGKISGAASITLTAASGIECTGHLNPRGRGMMFCDGVQFALSRHAGERKSFSGAVYREGTVGGLHYETAFGWGRGANEAVLRGVLDRDRTMTPSEVRATFVSPKAPAV